MLNDKSNAISELRAQNKANLDPHIATAKRANLPELMLQDGYLLRSSDGRKGSTCNQYEVIEGGHRTGNVFRNNNTGGAWVYKPVGEKAMNAVQYAQKEHGMSFPEAIRFLDPETPDLVTLKKEAGNTHRPQFAANAIVRVATPMEEKTYAASIEFTHQATPDQEKLCRDYCAVRGISPETVESALSVGVISFGVSNFDNSNEKGRVGVRFCGFDENGVMRNAETRLLTTKRVALCERGSNKAFSVILPGCNESVHVVEGGFDALALTDLCRRHGVEQPTIVVSGGSARTFITTDGPAQKALLAAKKIVIWAENEEGENPVLVEKKQAETDASHAKQRLEMIEAGCRAEIMINKPKGGFKDLAEKNLFETQQLLPDENEIEPR